MFRYVLLILGAVTLIGASALPALAQEGEGEVACAEVVDNVLAILTKYQEEGITAEEAAQQVAQELQSAREQNVGCDQNQAEEVLSLIEETLGASEFTGASDIIGSLRDK